MSTTTTIDNFIGGTFAAPGTGATEEIHNPATGDVIASAPLSGTADVDAAVAAAKGAFDDWAGTTPGERALRAAADRRRDRRARRGDLPGRVAERRQADRGDARGAAVDCGQPALLRRRGARHGGQGGGRVHGGLHVDDPARGDRRGRADRAMELSAGDGDLEDRPGDRRRQHRRPETQRADSADRRDPCGDLRRAPARRAW